MDQPFNPQAIKQAFEQAMAGATGEGIVFVVPASWRALVEQHPEIYRGAKVVYDDEVLEHILAP